MQQYKGISETNFEQIKQVLKEYLIPIYKVQKYGKLTHK